jgi:hypothetical protein
LVLTKNDFYEGKENFQDIQDEVAVTTPAFSFLSDADHVHWIIGGRHDLPSLKIDHNQDILIYFCTKQINITISFLIEHNVHGARRARGYQQCFVRRTD